MINYLSYFLYILQMGNFLFIEPFYGGSHKSFIDGFVKHSSHHIDLLTLPDRFWKWRMRGAATYIKTLNNNFDSYDAIIGSNMLSMSDFKALCAPPEMPLVTYFHENQILYPLKQNEQEDLHYGFTDFTTALTADNLVFNSHYHKNAFIDALPEFLKRFPDYKPLNLIESIKQKSSVLYPGCNLLETSSNNISASKPVFLWNHRWEHDKNPEEFFSILFEIQDLHIDFDLIVLGEAYSKTPDIFLKAHKKLSKEIIHWGFASEFSEYQQLLSSGNIVMSTSIQENYGISVIEAISAGNFPLLPDRLSYREIIPSKYHNLCIYKNRKDLINKIQKLITNYDKAPLSDLIKENQRFSWSQLIKEYDTFLTEIKKDR